MDYNTADFLSMGADGVTADGSNVFDALENSAKIWKVWPEQGTEIVTLSMTIRSAYVPRITKINFRVALVSQVVFIFDGNPDTAITEVGVWKPGTINTPVSFQVDDAYTKAQSEKLSLFCIVD